MHDNDRKCDQHPIIGVLFFVGYVVVAFLTAAWICGEDADWSFKNWSHNDEATARFFGTVIGGAIWPGYWAWTGARYIIHSARTYEATCNIDGTVVPKVNGICHIPK